MYNYNYNYKKREDAKKTDKETEQFHKDCNT